MRVPVDSYVEAIPHEKKPKGGYFKASVDLVAPSAVVYAPVTGKIAHLYKDKTQCGSPGTDSVQFAMSEEHEVDGDRKLTKRRVGLSHLVPVPGLGKGPLRHVAEGTVIGHVSGDRLHVSVNKAEMLGELTT